MGIPLEITDKICKSFGETRIEELDAIIASGEKIPEPLKECYQYTLDYPKLFDYVRKLSGMPKSFGRHACGFVVATRDLDYYLPSCYDDDGIRYLQGDMHDVENVGLVKIDILGLRTLDHEYEALALANRDEEYINAKQEYNDEKVWDVFRKGDTIGIFQFSSPGMRKTLQKMSVSSIDELSAANALFRPGAMAHIDEYCRRKKGEEEITYYHPDLEPILKETYGIIVFQEQLILIARLAKMRNPDILRKMVGKKSAALIPVVKPELHDGLIARGWTEEQFTMLWDVILASCNYLFNKSHASAYAILAYMTAKLKAYYPAEFFAGLLSSYIGESNFVKDSSPEIFADIAKHNIRYEPLNFRDDLRKCSVKDGKIVYALPLIKGFNTETAEILYSNKDFNGEYFSDLLARLYEAGLRKATLTQLISLGLFSEFGNTVKLTRLLNIFDLLDYGEKVRMKASTAAKYPELAEIIERNSTRQKSMLTNISVMGVMREAEERLKKSDIPERNLKLSIIEQQDLIGLAPFPTGREEDRATLFVTDVKPLCVKATGKQFGYSVFTSSLGSGIKARFSVSGKPYREWDSDPIKPNDIIRCTSYNSQKGFFNLLSWKQIYN